MADVADGFAVQSETTRKTFAHSISQSHSTPKASRDQQSTFGAPKRFCVLSASICVLSEPIFERSASIYESPEPTFGPPEVIFEGSDLICEPPEGGGDAPAATYRPPVLIHEPPEVVCDASVSIFEGSEPIFESSESIFKPPVPILRQSCPIMGQPQGFCGELWLSLLAQEEGLTAYFILSSIPTGQWSLPRILGRMKACFSRGRSAALTRK